MFTSRLMEVFHSFVSHAGLRSLASRETVRVLENTPTPLEVVKDADEAQLRCIADVLGLDRR